MGKKMSTLKIVLIVCVIIITLLSVGALTIYQVNEFYVSNDPILNEITTMLYNYFEADHFPTEGELRHLNGRNLLDEITIQSSKTGSYTINKKAVHICMKDINGDYYDRNMLIYVLIHEIAHVICDEIGHTPKFHEANDELLEHATLHSIYDPSQPIILDYCSHHADSTNQPDRMLRTLPIVYFCCINGRYPQIQIYHDDDRTNY